MAAPLLQAVGAAAGAHAAGNASLTWEAFKQAELCARVAKKKKKTDSSLAGTSHSVERVVHDWEETTMLLPPSDLKATDGTATAMDFLRLVRAEVPAVCSALGEEHHRALAFLVEMPAGEDSDGLLRLMGEWRQQLTDAWAAAARCSAPQEKKMAFSTALTRGSCLLYDLAVPLCTGSLERLGGALLQLSFAVRDRYLRINTMEPEQRLARAPERLAPEKKTEFTSEEIGVIAYLAGWVVKSTRDVAARSNRKASWVQVLDRMSEHGSAEAVSGSEDASLYIESRELWGRLLRVKPCVLECFKALELCMKAGLNRKCVLRHREAVVNHVSQVIKDSVEVHDAFRICFDALGGVPDCVVRTGIQRTFGTKYLHSRAKAFTKETMQDIDRNKGSMALRTVLKASRVQAQGKGAPKAAPALQNEQFGRHVLGTLTASELHSVLRQLASQSPEVLLGDGSNSLRKSDMQLIIRAYDPTQPEKAPQKVSKNGVHMRLVSYILQSNAFLGCDARVMKVS